MLDAVVFDFGPFECFMSPHSIEPIESFYKYGGFGIHLILVSKLFAGGENSAFLNEDGPQGRACNSGWRPGGRQWCLPESL